MINTDKIRELLEKDQNQIRLFRNGGISQNDLIKTSREISKEFLNIIDEHGFPYKSVVPEDVYKGAVTLSLHLDLKDLKFVFDLYIKNTSPDQLENEHKAIFVDKILVNSGKPQIYGTQFKLGKNKERELLPVEDEANLDERRSRAGLRPLDEYLNL